MKEKIGIEKLIELLNEYEPYIRKDGEKHDNIWYFVYKGGSAIFPKNVGENVIISKSYGFIKWLVENEKIDYGQLVGDNIWETAKDGGWTDYICLLMRLSVSDEPIEFLVSILKDDETEKIDKLLNGVKKTCENIGI